MGIAESYIYCPPEINRNAKIKDNETEINIDGIHAIIFNASSDKYIVFSHGNASDNYLNLSLARKMRKKTGMNVVIYDYHGYGLSCLPSETSSVSPAISEESCLLSLATVINYLNKNVANNNIILVGQSLGTGVVIDYAFKNSWQSPIILISPFTSILDIMVPHSWLYRTAQNFVDYYINSFKIPFIVCPVKIYHGKQDALIPCDHSEKLHNLLTVKHYEVTYIDEADHNNIVHYINFKDFCSL